MPWYKAGTVSVTQNSNAVIGTNTAFIANGRVGDGVRLPDGGWYEVTNIASDTAISISPNYQGATNGAGGYALAPLQGYVKDSADALRALVSRFGAQLAALGTTGNYDILPVAKGGTGATDGASALTSLGMKGGAYDALIKSVGFRGAPVGYNVQGLYMGWNGNGDGGANYICNRGGGLGGHAWWSVNSDNTAAGPVMTYSYTGVLTVSQVSTTLVSTNQINGLTTPITLAQGGTGGKDQATARNALGLGTGQAPVFAGLDIVGRVSSNGTWCRTGFTGSRGGTVYNFNWTGNNVDVYIDNTYVGTMTLFTSDYRIKKFIKELKVPSFLDRIDAYRLVTYERKIFGDVFRGDGRVYQGLIAHEAQEVNPLAVTGEKDGVDENGNARIQQLDPMALITDLMGAVKELRAELAALKASIQPAPEPVTA
ncbi:Tail fiber domain protein [Pseudomonas syringae pv. maculicola]|uniref:tail fiber domain-containing protein n=1 Tax=Pseudomonas syringae group genomosp. 3 TaxID=251701 RepID=UPI0006B92518|nr:tail fiber domain-containing protein [Pseudomonas syringae group genomosp. 3]KPC07140.1 Tail fiber domain protein [Pseudomonas syringae pv. maculicola]MBM0213016.1 tail fiber domain-containing protein [Pseudomonas syringae pv. maculicola]RMM78968.1 Tail fiber domain protein [Pseudomonas syringae pv. maculicola]